MTDPDANPEKPRPDRVELVVIVLLLAAAVAFAVNRGWV